MEKVVVEDIGFSLRELERTSIHSLFAYEDYLIRRRQPKLKTGEKVIQIGSKKYIRRSADEAGWL